MGLDLANRDPPNALLGASKPLLPGRSCPWVCTMLQWRKEAPSLQWVVWYFDGLLSLITLDLRVNALT